MKKLITMAALASATAFADPNPVVTDYKDTNTIILENMVDIYSSRQNVWLCGLGISSSGGSDNRVYYTKSKYSKGRNNLINSTDKALEAPINGDTVSDHASVLFNENYEVRYSDIRVDVH